MSPTTRSTGTTVQPGGGAALVGGPATDGGPAGVGTPGDPGAATPPPMQTGGGTSGVVTQDGDGTPPPMDPPPQRIAMAPVALDIKFDAESSKPSASWMFTRSETFAGFTNDMSCQVGGPTPAGTQDTIYPASLPAELGKLLQQWLIASASTADTPVQFRTAFDRFAKPGLLSQCHGALVVAKLVLGPNQHSDPFVVITDRPITSLSAVTMDSPSVTPAALGIDTEWAPGGVPIPVDADLTLLMLSLVNDTRSRSPAELAALFSTAADSIWVVAKGARMGLTQLATDKFTPAAAPDVDDWHSELFISGAVPKEDIGTMFGTAANIPPLVNGAPSHAGHNGAWVLSAIIPLPKGHNLPFGYGVKITPGLTLENFVMELRVWANATADYAAWMLGIAYLQAWFHVISASPSALALEVMALSQCTHSLSALTKPIGLITSGSDPIAINQEAYVGQLKFNQLHHWCIDRTTCRLIASKGLVTRFLEYVNLAGVAFNREPALSVGTDDPACYSYMWVLANPPTPSWRTSLDLLAMRQVLPLPSWAASFAQFNVNLVTKLVPTLQTMQDHAGQGSPARTEADDEAGDANHAAAMAALQALFAPSISLLHQATPKAPPKAALPAPPPLDPPEPASLPPPALKQLFQSAGASTRSAINVELSDAPRASSRLDPLGVRFVPMGIYQAPGHGDVEEALDALRTGWTCPSILGPANGLSTCRLCCPSNGLTHLSPRLKVACGLIAPTLSTMVPVWTTSAF